MTPNEYISRKEELKKEFDKKCRELSIDYAVSNNTIKPTDIIKDHCAIGKVISMQVYIGINKVPMMVYKCERLKANGEPRKKTEIIYIYQDNVKLINGEDYQYPHNAYIK